MNTMYIMNTVTRDCLGILKQFLGKNIIIHTPPRKGTGPDFRLTIPTQPQIELVGECKATIPTRANALYFLFNARRYAGRNGKIILFTKWIPEVVAQELRKAGIFFVDTVGNAYLWHPPQILIDIRGKRPLGQTEPAPGRLLEIGGLKICHLLLTQPQLINAPLRVIAEEANVALGTAHAVLRELRLAQMLLPGPNGTRRFGDVKEMIDTFVRGYAIKLRPACVIGRYRHRSNRPAEISAAFQERLMNLQGQWALTGGLAAKQLTEYLEPDTLTLFVTEQAEQLLKKEPMLPDRNGNATLLRFFAPHVIGHEGTQVTPLATPLLIYAELLNDGGPREVETATLIYEQWLAQGVNVEKRT